MVQHQIVAVVLIIVVLGHGAVGGGQYGGALRGRQVYAGAVLGESAAHPHIVRKDERQRKDNGLRPLAAQGGIQCTKGIIRLGGNASVDEFLPLLVGRLGAVTLSVIGGKPAR